MENVDYDNPFMGMCDVGQAEKILNQFLRDYPQGLSEAEMMLRQQLQALYSADQIVGDADDFHNYAVSISRLTDDSREALNITREGLKIHPKNTDLLADAISYGSSCNAKEECSKWYQTLVLIDKHRWTWRSFSFSITYLLDEWTSKTLNLYSIDDILKLVKVYQELMPYEEDAWYSEYKVYAGINKKEEGIEVLERAIGRFTFCPRCWMRYADIMIDRGEYEVAKPIVRKMCRNPKTRENVNASFMYLLDAQCKLYDFYNSEDYDEGIIDEEVVMKLYRAFRKVLSSQGLREDTKKTVEGYISDLYSETDIEFPELWRQQV